MKNCLLVSLLFLPRPWAEHDFLGWDIRRAKTVALSMRANGQAGSSFDIRVRATDRSYNYKLRATWMTPSTIRAIARLEQLTKMLTDEDTRKLVADAEAFPGSVIQVEIDPREGSGVIPKDWIALFGPSSKRSVGTRSVRGTNTPRLGELPALAGAAPRDYAYEIFWMVFPTTAADGSPLFSATDREAELTVRIYSKVGKVRWRIPDEIRARLQP